MTVTMLNTMLKSTLSLLTLMSLNFNLLVSAQDNWKATYNDVGADDYELIMEWDHNPNLSLVINSGVVNPGNSDGSGDSGWGGSKGVCDVYDENAPKAPTDGLAYWYPRFYPKPVSAEITKKTGIEFASVDWQPCGHKDVVICHAESHYDFHLYYVPLSELNTYTCTAPSPTCPKGPDNNPDYTKNKSFFKLMKDNMPIKYSKSSSQNGNNGAVEESLNFCVDQTSAMPASGIHYGDKQETLGEWKTPVTIMGSYDCKLTFFEPMVSWKWVSGQIKESENISWPKWESGEITYDKKTYQPLPTSWKVEASESCKTVTDGSDCHVKITVYGKRCKDPNGCGPLPQVCAQQKDCKTEEYTGILPESSVSTATTTTTVMSSGVTGSTTTTTTVTVAVTSSTNSTSTVKSGTTIQNPNSSTYSTSFTSSLGNNLSTYTDTVSGSLKLSLYTDKTYSSSALFQALGRPISRSLMKYLTGTASDTEYRGVRVAITELKYMDNINNRKLLNTVNFNVGNGPESKESNNNARLTKFINAVSQWKRGLSTASFGDASQFEVSYQIGLKDEAINTYGLTKTQVTSWLDFESTTMSTAAQQYSTQYRSNLVSEFQNAAVQQKNPGSSDSDAATILRGTHVGQVLTGQEIKEHAWDSDSSDSSGSSGNSNANAAANGSADPSSGMKKSNTTMLGMIMVMMMMSMVNMIM